MEASLFLFWSPNLHHGPRAETRGNGNENCELTTQETRKCANRLPFSRKAEYWETTKKKWLIHSSHYAHNESVERFGKGSVHELHELKALKTLKKKTEYCQMLKSSKGHKFRAKLGSVRFHYLKAVVCMYARSTKKKFQVPFGLKKSLWMGSYFYSEVKRHCLFLRAQSLVFNLNARKLLSSLN